MKSLVLAAALATSVLLAGCASSTPATTSKAHAAAGSSSSGSGAGSSGASSNGAAASVSCPPASGAPTRTLSFPSAPPMCLAAGKTYVATVTTDIGAFEISLDAAKAPNTANNFVFLARNKYYDGIVFHRVIAGFMAQTGDPTGTGRGGPGYKFADELPKAGEYKIGSVAMANAGPNTNGSQFFIVTGQDGVGLPPSYSLFGQVTSGMDVVSKIEADGGDPATSGMPPKVTHKMVSVTVVEK